MEQLQNKNIGNQVREDGTDEITSMVNDFVQMWTKFEVMLQKELAEKKYFLNLKQNENNIDYGLFYRVSSIIFPKSQITMGELSNRLSVPFSKATRIVNWLVNNELAVRLSDPSDRRIVRVALSDKGRELHITIGSYMKKKIQKLISASLSSKERGILLDLINRVASVLKTQFS